MIIKKQLKTKALASSTMLSLLIVGTSVQADDIEVYLQPPPDPVAPNVLFILDESGSMSSSSPSRMEQLKAAMTELLDDPDMANTRAGIMGYTTNTGNNGPLRIRVVSDFAELGEVGSPARTSMKSMISTLTPRSYTPSVKALEFAADWFSDGFNQGENPVGWDNNDDDGDGSQSDQNAWDSPVDLWCRPNHMVLLTDGRPNSNSPTNGQGYGLTDYRPTDPLGSDSCTSDSTTRWQNGRCGAEIASWAFNTDLEPDESSWPEQQNIITHTIGFHTDDAAEAFLRNISSDGGGNFYPGDSASDLVAAFTAIVQEAQTSIPYTYNAPTIPFNANNAATSGNDLYVPLFATDTKKLWKGNIKKYRISYNTTTNDIDIKDRNSQDVLDTALNFLPNRADYWNNTGSVDGGDPLQGGAASNMSGERFLYTHLDTPANPSPQADLTHENNRITLLNDLITEDMLGVANENNPERKRRNMLNWANWLTNNGNNPRTGDNAPAMGAPLHTSPIVVRYSGGRELILINTTEGVLHAFDGTIAGAGDELWAFMPDELLNTIKLAKRNRDSALPMYGLDGPMTYYELNSRKYIVFGMRRGGRNYYALDITDPDSPSFAWEIKAGVTPGFDNLGQTWSKPIFTKLKIESAAVQDVLIFGGGYDTGQDTATTRSDDGMGNSIFVINARTGALIREIDSSVIVEGSMGNGIAGNVLTIDINTDGITDRLYAADVGGRIIRIDIPDEAIYQITGSRDLTGTIVADVGGADGFQRFFNTPEVAYYDRGGVRYLALMIASGHRPDPLDDSVTDRFYMIKDPNVWAAPADGTDAGSEPDYGSIITEAGDGSAGNPGLFDATDNQVQDGSEGDVNDSGSKLYAQNLLRQKKGWYINLAPGEKGFSEARVYDYAVLFTTYKGTRSADSDPCLATSTAGESQLYVVDMTDASAVFNADGSKFVKNGSGDAPLDANDRNVPLGIPGMPPAPVLTFPEEKRIANAIVGLQSVAQWPDRFHPISWEEVIDD